MRFVSTLTLFPFLSDGYGRYTVQGQHWKNPEVFGLSERRNLCVWRGCLSSQRRAGGLCSQVALYGTQCHPRASNRVALTDLSIDSVLSGGGPQVQPGGHKVPLPPPARSDAPTRRFEWQGPPNSQREGALGAPLLSQQRPQHPRRNGGGRGQQQRGAAGQAPAHLGPRRRRLLTRCCLRRWGRGCSCCCWTGNCWHLDASRGSPVFSAEPSPRSRPCSASGGASASSTEARHSACATGAWWCSSSGGSSASAGTSSAGCSSASARAPGACSEAGGACSRGGVQPVQVAVGDLPALRHVQRRAALHRLPLHAGSARDDPHGLERHHHAFVREARVPRGL